MCWFYRIIRRIPKIGVRLPKALGNANLLVKMARAEIPSRAESTLACFRHRPAHSPYHDVLTGSIANDHHQRDTKLIVLDYY